MGLASFLPTLKSLHAKFPNVSALRRRPAPGQRNQREVLILIS
jgi:hypothetical protein